MDPFLMAALDEARTGRAEGGIPIGSVLVYRGEIIGRGHNRRVQRGSPILHAEMDALENAGRRAAKVYRESVLYTTLSPCAMCSGAIVLYGIPRVIAGEKRSFVWEDKWLRSRRGFFPGGTGMQLGTCRPAGLRCVPRRPGPGSARQ